MRRLEADHEVRLAEDPRFERSGAVRRQIQAVRSGDRHGPGERRHTAEPEQAVGRDAHGASLRVAAEKRLGERTAGAVAGTEEHDLEQDTFILAYGCPAAQPGRGSYARLRVPGRRSTAPRAMSARPRSTTGKSEIPVNGSVTPLGVVLGLSVGCDVGADGLVPGTVGTLGGLNGC